MAGTMKNNNDSLNRFQLENTEQNSVTSSDNLVITIDFYYNPATQDAFHYRKPSFDVSPYLNPKLFSTTENSLFMDRLDLNYYYNHTSKINNTYSEASQNKIQKVESTNDNRFLVEDIDDDYDDQEYTDDEYTSEEESNKEYRFFIEDINESCDEEEYDEDYDDEEEYLSKEEALINSATSKPNLSSKSGRFTISFEEDEINLEEIITKPNLSSKSGRFTISFEEDEINNFDYSNILLDSPKTTDFVEDEKNIIGDNNFDEVNIFGRFTIE